MRRAFPTLSGARRSVELIGIALVVVSVAWWAIVYGQVVVNTGMAPQRALPCLFRTSDLCSLAMALCKEWHILGIKRYSAELLWIGFAACALALGTASLARR